MTYLNEERQEPTTQNTLLSKTLLQISWRNQKLSRKAKVKRTQRHQASFIPNAEGPSLGSKHERRTRLKKVQWSESCSVTSNSFQPHGLYSPWHSPGQNAGVERLSLLQRIFPTQGSNPGLLHCRQILYQLSHKGSLRTLEWIAYPFSSGSSWPRNQTSISCLAGGFFTNRAIREAQLFRSSVRFLIEFIVVVLELYELFVYFGN